MLAGLCLRWRMVESGRALWLDPAMLVWNVVQRGYGQLFLPLDENQAAPYGFLCLLKAAGGLGDYSERSLLVFPFLFAVAALVVFARLAVDLLGQEGAPFAIWPLALSSTAVYYAGEVKQYSADLFAATLLTWLASRYLRTLEKRDLQILGGATLLLAWFSHTSFLVAGALWALLLVQAWSTEKAGVRGHLYLWCAAIAVHHSLLYFLQMRKAAGADLFTYHQSTFAPWPPWHDWAWYRDTILGYVEFPLGYPGALILPLLGCCLGLVGLHRRRLEAGLLLAPLLAVLAAGALKVYPLPTGQHDIHSRLLLFTLPFVCLLIGRGFKNLLPSRGFSVALILLAALSYPTAVRSFGNPGYLRQEMPSLLEELRSQIEPGDQVYVFYAAEPAFRFYTRKEPITHLAGQPVSTPEEDLRRDAARLENGRVWVVMAHFFAGEDQVLRGILEERGERLMKHIHDGTVLELYLLREPESQTE